MSGDVNRLEIITLGQLQIRVDGQNRALGTRKQRALLALLVVNRRRSVPADHIIIALWGPDAPPRRREDVWVYVSRLRKSLGAMGHLLRRDPSGYVLDVDDDVIDSERYEALAEEGRQLVTDDPAAASLVLGEALAAWTGGAFEEFQGKEFVAAEVARLEESRLTVLEMRVQADLAWRDADLIIPEIEGLTMAHPLRVSLTESLMMALYRRGRQADALRAYDRYATHLADEVGLEPPEELRILEEQILLDNPASSGLAGNLHSGLPQRIASFVGREAELNEITKMISDQRLISIVGPGGVGKSALALEVARRLALSYEDAALVDITNPDTVGDIPSTVSEALRAPASRDTAMDSILTPPVNCKVILIFDNCEAASVEAAAAIVMLLQASAELRIIATSRVVLGIPGEQVVRLAPLSIRPNGETEQLLKERVSSHASPDLGAIDGDDLHILCVKTAGLPLAIELVAAQLDAWSVKEVISALDEPLTSLAVPERVGPPHHRDMWENISWSERLLPPLASTLLARISIFGPSFSFDAVAPVTAFPPLSDTTVRQEFQRLVNSSMVLSRPGSPGRYYLLDPVREYAAIRLAESSDAAQLSENHASYFATTFRELSSAFDHGTDSGALERARLDDEDLIAALNWTIDADRTLEAQEFAISAIPFWWSSARVPDILPILDRTLRLPGPADKARAELLFTAMPLYQLGRGARAGHELLVELEGVARDIEDPEVAAWTDLRRADAASAHDAPEEVVSLYQQAASSLREIGSTYEFTALHQLGWYQFRCWDRWADTEVTVAAWSDLTESLGSRNPGPVVLRGWLALAQGHTETAERTFVRVSTELRRQGDHRMAALQMLPRSIASLQSGNVLEAGRRIDVAVAAGREIGAVPWLQNALLTRSYVRVALDDREGATRDLIEVGRVMKPGDAPDVAPALAHAAATALMTTQPEAAVTLLSAASCLPSGNFTLRLTHLLVVPALADLLDATETSVRDAITPDAFGSAWKRGATMDAEEAATAAVRAIEDVALDNP